MSRRLIDADALRDKLQREIDIAIPPYDDVIGSIRCGVRLARNIVEDEPTIDAVPISFIEEQIELCNLIGFKRGEECYMALIEDWREKNGAETD